MLGLVWSHRVGVAHGHVWASARQGLTFDLFIIGHPSPTRLLPQCAWGACMGLYPFSVNLTAHKDG